MPKNIVFYLTLFFSLPLSAATVADKEVLQRIINNFTLECLGEPAWPISLPVADDPWLSGRLDVLADAGLACRARQGHRHIWFLTPAGTGSMPCSGDRCCGRMLLRHGPQEVSASH